MLSRVDDRQPMNRRCRDNAEISEAREACRKGARYRRGAYPKRVDTFRQARKFCIVRRPEVLFLVDEDEHKVVESYVLRG